MNKSRIALLLFLLCCTSSAALFHTDSTFSTESPAKPSVLPQAGSYTGSSSCRECHEKFYKLWAPSHHGRAMQPYTDAFAESSVTPQKEDIVIDGLGYKAHTGKGQGWVSENGPKGEKKYPIAHVLGGKNVYYFLTPMDRGRLQVLPVAYDVRTKEWYDTTASMIRHFTDRRDQPVQWTDSALTFNTSCYGCHVSQLSTNYDLKTETYHTTWREPGINCETCHGPADEHIRVCKAAPKGTAPKDLKIIRGGRDFTHEQNNATCSSCHAKAIPINTTFQPGDRFFDHYDLVTLEHGDFYPDGRDLGENYTYTTWRMSPCVKSGKLDCLHCHTSSGRFKFKGTKANNACMPCHAEHVKNPTKHTHHKPDSTGNSCIACHMPMTEFARMRRSDHSMLPPTPAATIAFKSPNACNNCHKDKSPQWADKWVRKWRSRDYQAPVLHRAELIEAARKQDWKALPDILKYLKSDSADEVFAASLIRLLRSCPDEHKIPVLLEALKNPSPLVRSSAAAVLGDSLNPEVRDALLAATQDDYKVVRVRAAMSLAGYPRKLLGESDHKRLKAASDEYEASMQSRPDDWHSYYNLGNYFLNRGEVQIAAISFERASAMRPGSILPLVNVSMAYARLGRTSKAEQALQKALAIDPNSAEANFNLGLVKAEQKDYANAESCLRKAFKADPQLAAAAYNLGVLLAGRKLDEAIHWCRKAYELRPANPKYSYTLAFYSTQKGDKAGAISVLKESIQRRSADGAAYGLLGDIYEAQGRSSDAGAVFLDAIENGRLSPRERSIFRRKLNALNIKDGSGPKN
jgi:tetratricopeptide (TPR) repeat protein